MMPIITTKAQRMPWTMQDEIKFLTGLGTWTKHENSAKRRLRLLENYLAANNVKVNWGELDPIKIRAVVLDILATEYPSINLTELRLERPKHEGA